MMTINQILEIDPGFDRDRLERFEKKAKSRCDEVFGWKLRVKTGKNSVTTGTVVSAQYLGLKFKSRRIVPVYKVRMECGESRIQRVFTLSTFHEQS